MTSVEKPKSIHESTELIILSLLRIVNLGPELPGIGNTIVELLSHQSDHQYSLSQLVRIDLSSQLLPQALPL